MQVAQRGEDALLGRVLAGKYRVESVLGRGGMGNVYLATQTPLELKVVIKTLRSEFTGDQAVAQRFYHEAKATSELRHPNCVSILDFGESEGQLFIAMEYLQGEDLAAVIDREGAVPPLRAIRIMKQVLEVAEAAHRKNIVHRDLKPENIMLQDLAIQKDFVKVLDFGIAKITDPLMGDKNMTGTGFVIGTPSYMAPEQAQGRPVDGRSDIYALGVILFELLAGRTPFISENSAELLAAHVMQEPPPLAELAPHIPANLAALIDQCLAKEPRKRPQTALEVRRALEVIEREIERGKEVKADPSLAMRATIMTGSGETSMEGAFPSCPRCGAGVPPSAKFCPECGAASVRSRQKTTGMADRFADLRKYLPSALVDEISNVKSAKINEQREIVAMVADLRGTRLSSEEAATELELIQEGLETMAVRAAGRVERGLDGALAVLFGLTTAHGDDAERAVRTALEFRQFVRGRNNNDPRALSVSIVIHAGDALVKTTAAGPQYTAIGDTVSLPTRLAQAVEPGVIAITAKAKIRASRCAKFRGMRPVGVRSLPNPVPVDEIIGLQETASAGGQVALATPPLVGRKEQLAGLLRLVSEGKDGALAHITAETGAGKTRLLEALEKNLQTLGRLPIRVNFRADPGARRSPCTLVDALFLHTGGTVVALRALGVADDAAALLHAFTEAGRVAGLSENDGRVAAAGAIRRALHSLTSHRGVVVLLDDVNTPDPVTRELIRGHLQVPIKGITFITTSRPGYLMPWDDLPNQDAVIPVTLPPLPLEDMLEMIRQVLSPSPPPAVLIETVANKAHGSPLVALELLRSLIDAGTLSNKAGRWALTCQIDQIKLPDSLADILRARLDTLNGFARDVLACAAAIGEVFPVALVDQVLAPSRGAPIDKDVQFLIERGYFTPTSDSGKLRFTETSTREDLYGRLSAVAKKKIHAAIGTAAADLAATLNLQPEEVADHLAVGEEYIKALSWYEQAVTVATSSGDDARLVKILRAAVSVSQRAIDATKSAGQLGMRYAEDALALARTALKIGEIADLGPILDVAIRRANEGENQALVTRLHRVKGCVLAASGSLSQAQKAFEFALQSALGLRDDTFIAEVHADLGEILENQGKHEMASTYLLRALEIVQRSAAREIAQLSLRVLSGLGRIALLDGEPDQAERFFNEALNIAEASEEPHWAAKILGNIGAVYHARKNYSVATEFVNRALKLAQECGDQIGVTKHTNNLGILYFLSGNAAAARRQFNKAYEIAERVGWKEGMAMASAGQAQVRGN